MAEQYSVEAFLKANTQGFIDGFARATAAAQTFEQEIKNLNTGKFEEAGKQFETAGRNMQTTGKKIAGIGAGLTAGITVPLVAAGGASLNAAIDFESAFAGVRKTVDATESEFAILEEGIRSMAKRLPASAAEIAGVAEAAGQLGIEKDSILDFTETMINLGEATNLTADEAATSLAQFANVVQMPQDEFDKLGSSVVALGNTMATTEADIVSMGQRLAGTGAQVGLSEADIMALAASMSSVGIEAEAGGTAMSSTMTKIRNAVGAGGEDLAKFAEAAGMSADEFARSFEEDPITAINSFITGLGESGAAGENLNQKLEAMGITGIREVDTLLRLAGAGDILTDAVKTSSDAWEANTALTDEAAQRYATTQSQIDMMKNRLTDLGITIGGILLPIFQKMLDFITPIIEKFSNMSERSQTLIVVMAAIAAAVGPVVLAFGAIIAIIGSVIANFGILLQRFAPIIKSSTLLTRGVGLIGRAFSLLLGPVGIAIGVLMALIPVFVKLYQENETFRNIVLMVWESIKSAITTAIEAIKPAFAALSEAFMALMPVIEFLAMAIGGALVVAFGIAMSIFTAATALITPLINAFLSLVQTVINVAAAIGSVLMGDFSAALEYWNLAVESSINFFKSLWEGVVGFISTLVTTIIEFFYNLYMELVGNSIIPDMVRGILDWILNLKDTFIQYVTNLVTQVISFFTNLWTTAVSVIGSMVSTLKQKWSDLKADIIAKASEIYSNAKQKFEEMKEAISTAVRNAAQAVVDKFREMLNNAREKAQEIVNTARDKFEEVKRKISEKMSEAVQEVVKFVGQMPGKIRDGVSDMISAGADLVGGVISGIKSKIDEGLGVIGGLARGLISKFKRETDTHSPSRAFADIAKWFAPGIVKGINKTSGKAIDSVGQLAQDLTRNFNPDLQLSAVDYNSQIRSMNGQIRRDMSTTVSSELTMNKQPAQIRLNIGGRDFTAFVDDISSEQALVARLERGR